MEQKQLFLIILSFILTGITGIVFFLTGITINSLLTLDFFYLIDLFLSINFIIFVIFGILTLVLYSLLLDFVEENRDLFIVIGAYCAGVFIGTIFTPLFMLPAIFGALGIFVKKNFKTKNDFDKGRKISKSIILFISLGLLLIMILTTGTNMDFYEEKFVDDIIGSTIGSQEELKDSISQPIIQLIITDQKETLKAVTQLPGYSGLESNGDMSSKQFVNSFNALQNKINSQDYKERLENQISGEDIGINFIEDIKGIKKISQWAWLLYAIEIPLLLFLVSNLIISNIVGLIYLILKKIFLDEDLDEDIAEENF